MFPTLPSPLLGSGLMDDAVVASEGEPLDDSQATRLNDLPHTEDGSVSSSDNSEGRQGSSGFDEEDSLGSFIEETAGAEDDWDRSPPSETGESQQQPTTSQANHHLQQQATSSQVGVNLPRQQQQQQRASNLPCQQQQRASTPQPNHLRQQQATTSHVNLPQQQQQQWALKGSVAANNNNTALHDSVDANNNNTTSQQRRSSSSISSTPNQRIRPLLSNNNNLTNLPLSSPTIPEWEGCNPDAVIKRLKLISKDDLQLSGKREFFKSYSFWEKMTMEQRNKTISWFRSLPEHLQGLLHCFFFNLLWHVY